MIVVTLYSRPECHLCDEMKAVVERVAQSLSRAIPLTVDVVDVSADPQLEGRYGVYIPVLLIAGKKAAKHRVSEEELRRILIARAGEAGGAGQAGG